MSKGSPYIWYVSVGDVELDKGEEDSLEGAMKIVDETFGLIEEVKDG